MQISIPQPCTQSWNEMSQTGEGRYCSTCQKTVIDFSALSSDEIQAYFLIHTRKTCGRFSIQQLDNFNKSKKHHQSKQTALNRFGILVGLLSFFYSGEGHAEHFIKTEPYQVQNIAKKNLKINILSTTDTTKKLIVTGELLDENKQPINYASLRLAGRNLNVTFSNDGHFIATLPQSASNIGIDIVVLGFETKHINIKSKTERYDMGSIVMKSSIALTGEVVVVQMKQPWYKYLWRKLTNLL